MAEGENKSTQLNIRIDPALEQSIDRARIDKAREFGRIPSRSEIVRLALDAYLGIADEPAVETSPARPIAHAGRRTD
jgi:hypothetical protein